MVTNAELIEQCQVLLHKRYPDYAQQKPGRRVLLANAAFCRDFKVVERGGNNRGELVRAVLEGVRLGEGYAWCGAAQEIACDVAGITIGPSDRNSARVMLWREWAADAGRLLREPAPGRLCLYNHEDGTGHIGIVAQVYADGRIRSYEGNTSAGTEGSQRDGGGWYERIRPGSTWQRFINLD
jgi:hypothetical protein